MKASHIIAALAASLMLFAYTPTISAQRGAANHSRSQAPGGGNSRDRHASAPQHSNNGGSHQSQNKPQMGHSGGNQGGQHHEHHSAQAPQHHQHHAAPAPQHHAPAHPQHHAPGPQHHHHAAAPAPHHHHAAAPAPHHHHHPAPAPRHYVEPHHHHAHVFAPRPIRTTPVYHHHIDQRARVFYIDEVPYYTWGGVYYRYVPSYGYEEIVMPEGVVVTDLPYGASRVYVNEVGYYQADDMWFQPVTGGYLLVQKPVAHVTVAVPRPTISFHASFGF